MSAVKLKICGMKNADNINDAAKVVPDFMGFIFYPHSKRFVGADFIIPHLPASISKVGVFVNSTIDEIKLIVKNYKLDYVQLHGNESPDFCSEAHKFVGVIKAFGVHDSFDFSICNQYQQSCNYFLFDTQTSEYGGSGLKFGWEMLKKYNCSTPFFLSGGINMEDLSQILYLKSQIPNLYAIDVNSKFEIAPGLKDINKLKLLTNELSG
ncbi:MAG: phosphoribosylanthranilate isomerase [Bacteroidia bacterium]|nr:phosphoribosylanthranilate isomerase [Bacteroidia bacterium]